MAVGSSEGGTDAGGAVGGIGGPGSGGNPSAGSGPSGPIGGGQGVTDPGPGALGVSSGTRSSSSSTSSTSTSRSSSFGEDVASVIGDLIGVDLDQGVKGIISDIVSVPDNPISAFGKALGIAASLAGIGGPIGLGIGALGLAANAIGRGMDQANPGPGSGGPAASSPAGGAQAAAGHAPGTGVSSLGPSTTADVIGGSGREVTAAQPVQTQQFIPLASPQVATAAEPVPLIQPQEIVTAPTPQVQPQSTQITFTPSTASIPLTGAPALQPSQFAEQPLLPQVSPTVVGENVVKGPTPQQTQQTTPTGEVTPTEAAQGPVEKRRKARDTRPTEELFSELLKRQFTSGVVGRA